MSSDIAFVVEVCVDSLDSAIAACEVRQGDSPGRIRLEICGNLGIGGGTTPSLGLVKSIQKALPGVETMVMIRPRIGDFCFTEHECAVMCEDIALFKQVEVTGVVIGALTPHGQVHIEQTKRLVSAAAGLSVTFHRAFDMTVDGKRALRELAAIPGIHRVLTSGHGRTAPKSIETLNSLLEELCDLRPDLRLLVGSGINANTLPPLLEALEPHFPTNEVHLSGGSWCEGHTVPIARKKGMEMGAGGDHDWQVWRTERMKVASTYDAFYKFRQEHS